MHTEVHMPKTRIAVTLKHDLLVRLDRIVTEGAFPNRNKAVEAAIEEKLERMKRGRLARECARLDPEYEKALAEEGMEEGFAP